MANGKRRPPSLRASPTLAPRNTLFSGSRTPSCASRWATRKDTARPAGSFSTSSATTTRESGWSTGRHLAARRRRASRDRPGRADRRETLRALAGCMDRARAGPGPLPRWPVGRGRDPARAQALPALSSRSWTGWSCPWSSIGSADPSRPDAGWSGPRTGPRSGCTIDRAGPIGQSPNAGTGATACSCTCCSARPAPLSVRRCRCSPRNIFTPPDLALAISLFRIIPISCPEHPPVCSPSFVAQSGKRMTEVSGPADTPALAKNTPA